MLAKMKALNSGFPSEWFEKPRCGGHPDRLRGRTFRFPAGHGGSIPADEDLAAHHPPDPELYEICVL